MNHKAICDRKGKQKHNKWKISFTGQKGQISSSSPTLPEKEFLLAILTIFGTSLSQPIFGPISLKDFPDIKIMAIHRLS